jgi:hypothetical protein
MDSNKAVVLIAFAGCLAVFAGSFSDAFDDPISQQIEKCKYACKEMSSYDAEKKICTCKEYK